MIRDEVSVFVRSRSEVAGCVYIPKYYDPSIDDALQDLASDRLLVSLGAAIASGEVEVSTGDEIGKMAYGTGTIPFVRTSDISNWEIRTDPKQGVSREVYEDYAEKHDVQPGDVLLVRDGTYLIGSAALVSELDREFIYQSHLLKFRATGEGVLDGPLLLAALTSPLVQRQIRSKQFTADIIDTLGDRFRELVLPLPSSKEAREVLSEDVKAIVTERAELKERVRRIPLWAQGLIDDPKPSALEHADADDLEADPGSIRARSSIANGIYLPKYYNPQLDEDLSDLSASHELVALADLVDRGDLTWGTGDEIGKMAYGTGTIPFVRTSDFSNWELKFDPKHSISNSIYEKYAEKQDVQAGDILLVRDGTYLVGSSTIISEDDPALLYCGGLYKLRSENDLLDPYLLLAVLGSPICRKQMRSRQFTRDVIDTLGQRLFEILIPIPRSTDEKQAIADETKRVVKRRVELRERARILAAGLSP